MGKSAKAWVGSVTKNPLENIATGGSVAAYKAANAAIGNKLPTSTSLGLDMGLADQFRAKQLEGYDVPQSLQEAQTQAMQRQSAIASGQAPSYSRMAFNAAQDKNARQALAMAASQRGASNPALAFRQAQIANQDANLQGAQQAAAMEQQERQQADSAITGQYKNAQNLAYNQNASNLAAQNAQKNANMQMVAGLGGTAASLFTGGLGGGALKLATSGVGSTPTTSGGIDSSAYNSGNYSSGLKFSQGGRVPGVAPYQGNDPQNDIVPTMLSPGEVVVPRSAVRSEKALKMFIEKIKIEEKLKKMGA
jgi:hypothetical protein